MSTLFVNKIYLALLFTFYYYRHMAKKTKLKQWIDRQPYGTAIRLADWLDVHKSNISMWASGVREIPEKHCEDIAAFAGDELTCEDLRPDIDWGVSGRSK